MHFIKQSPSLQKQTFERQISKPHIYDALSEHSSKNNALFSFQCNGIVSPGNIISTNQSGFSPHIDPYVSITTKSYKPWNCPKEQTITFWNWNSTEGNNLVNQKKHIPQAVLCMRKQSLTSQFQSEMSSNYNHKSLIDLDKGASLLKSVVLQPTCNIDYNTEYSSYKNKFDCSRLFKQRKY